MSTFVYAPLVFGSRGARDEHAVVPIFRGKPIIFENHSL